jgi:hypothetical protein
MDMQVVSTLVPARPAENRGYTSLSSAYLEIDLSTGADGGDGWKKLVCPLKLWRKELFKYMSVG